MPLCFFATDLHGHTDRYRKLLTRIAEDKPEMVFLGGDLLPHGFLNKPDYDDFFRDFLFVEFSKLKSKMGIDYPEVMLILGNDDARIFESDFIQAQDDGLWEYMHEKKYQFGEFTIYGYAYVPPTPFRLKDWERYDVSRFADIGCIHPLEGAFSIEPEGDIEYQTIKEDLEKLTSDDELSQSIMLFHSPPYHTSLDRAKLDGIFIDHVPLDVHVGSIAIKRFIEERKPMMTLHGHIHEASRITGLWHEYIGNTLTVNGAWDGPELSLICFDLDEPDSISRLLL